MTRLLVALALLSLGCSGEVVDSADAAYLDPATYLCGWVEAPQPAVRLDPLPSGMCWRVRPETADRAASLDGARPCDVQNGDTYYLGGSVIRMWVWVNTGGVSRVFEYKAVPCPP